MIYHVKLDVSFVCPKCGMDRFSSSNCTSLKDMTRYCTTCAGRRKSSFDKFPVEFHQRYDWKYFRIVSPGGIRRFKNAAEYELVMDLIRNSIGGGIRPT